MLRILGTRKTLCDGMSRRDFLQVGGIGAFGLSLADVTTARALEDLGTAFGQAKSCMLLFSYGSPSSHETFDPKPEMPDVQGEMKSTATNVPGLHVCDHLPRLAKVLDNPVSPKDILATAFHLLGIDPHTTVPDREGRPHPIAGSGKLRPELLG